MTVGKTIASKAARTVQEISKNQHLPNNSRVFSLIQPTGKFHIGNYLGAIQSWKTLSETESPGTQYIFGIADLHAITTGVKPAGELRSNRHEAMAGILSCGLNPKKCILFHQSSVPEHAELHWYLTCLTSMGALNRMTQWKSKARQLGDDESDQLKFLEHTKAGLLCYPILQAADILIYRSTHVPVGDDQSQHLEMCRSVAINFNNSYKTNFFPIPQTLLTPSKKILSLRNPLKKMSKSDPDQSSCIYITDAPEVIAKKIRKATTDSVQGPVYFDPEARPGVSNLINILSGVTSQSIEQVVEDLAYVKDHKQFKDHVTDVLVTEFKQQRELFEELMKDGVYLEKVCHEGRDKAREIATKNIEEVRKLIGMD
ncbi:mitochondrial tryptophanyl-tRNA synthetase [Spathaspora passalidarum NRRL Y-27907]|uniref:Tryptophan--tRNA ligase, mitochondrial n=1 Tax=Spathaspora passalidarum (strain NRRL Y-27907 / 11-Y1) TaxID=619300 RepID=G3APS0_SPAPN|nr:mitochondrial tryptophanyl-tRNA synthetase [Spathaspora passalidarum NRRL Y-27907]EGW32241.1 mitochondrial tryptophanyl-tRNA synthetase [Spathaspora passalidarum NRRL Y-27907]